ncbi:MAG: glutamate dehydrogenase, partial [Candidatus Marinimicrobia bacterium]|nr:glutamate dehydrogenase [Candidatus Neomarinimicrobiota bacterium]
KAGHTPAVVTGKPLELGGSVGREEATGKGVVIIADEWASQKGESLKDATVVIQGFGNVGTFAALHFTQKGARVIAVSDVGGGLVNDKGLDIPLLLEHVKSTGSVVGFAEGDALERDEVIYQKCDYLVPAALGGAVTGQNADRINCQVLVEAANHPVTAAAEPILLNKGIDVIPDLIANAGGVTVSYFEWVQNIQQFAWQEEKVDEELNRILKTSFNQVMEFHDGCDCTLRQACMALALQRVYQASKARGYIRV